MKIQEFYQIHKKKIAAVLLMMMMILVLILIAGVVFFFVRGNKKPTGGQEVLFGEESGEIATYESVIEMEPYQVKFDVEGLSEGLWIEELYAECGDTLSEGDRVIRFSEESVAFARAELEQAKRDAEMALHTGKVAYEESKITLRYEKERAVLKGELAKEVYDDTVEALKERENKANEALNEAKAKISEYEKLLDAKSSQDPYQVKAYKKIYDDNLKLLTKQMEQNGYTWEQVVEGSVEVTQSEKLYVLQQLYDVLEQNLEDYENAQETYNEAVAEATINLQTTKLGLSALEAEVQEAKAAYETDVSKAKLVMEQKQTAAEHAQEDYVTKLEAAEAEYNRLLKAKENAEENLVNFARLVGTGYYYASQNGTILQMGVGEERYLTEDTIILEYGSMENLAVTVSVEQASVANIAVGDVAYIKTAEHGGFQGSVVEMSPIPLTEGDLESAYKVKVALEGNTEDFVAGERVTVMFRVGGTANEETK